MDDISQKVIRYSTIILVVTFAIVIAGSFLYRRAYDVKVPVNLQNSSRTEYDNEEQEVQVPSDEDSAEISEKTFENGENVNTEDESDNKISKQKWVKIDFSDGASFNKNIKEPEEMIQLKNEENNLKVDNGDSSVYVKAESLREQSKYESAVYEYEKIASQTYDKIVKAKCYEEIANTYSSIRRYVSALPFAQLSYDLNASEKVKALLMDLYIKTGHPDKASKLASEKVEQPNVNAEEKKQQNENNELAELETIDLK